MGGFVSTKGAWVSSAGFIFRELLAWHGMDRKVFLPLPVAGGESMGILGGWGCRELVAVSVVLHFYFNLAMTGAFVFGVWIRNGQSVSLSKGQVICISVDSISQIHIALVSTEHRGGGDERLCWMCDCTCLESDRSKSSGQLGH